MCWQRWSYQRNANTGLTKVQINRLAVQFSRVSAMCSHSTRTSSIGVPPGAKNHQNQDRCKVNWMFNVEPEKVSNTSWNQQTHKETVPFLTIVRFLIRKVWKLSKIKLSIHVRTCFAHSIMSMTSFFRPTNLSTHVNITLKTNVLTRVPGKERATSA